MKNPILQANLATDDAATLFEALKLILNINTVTVTQKNDLYEIKVPDEVREEFRAVLPGGNLTSANLSANIGTLLEVLQAKKIKVHNDTVTFVPGNLSALQEFFAGIEKQPPLVDINLIKTIPHNQAAMRLIHAAELGNLAVKNIHGNNEDRLSLKLNFPLTYDALYYSVYDPLNLTQPFVLDDKPVRPQDLADGEDSYAQYIEEAFRASKLKYLPQGHGSEIIIGGDDSKLFNELMQIAEKNKSSENARLASLPSDKAALYDIIFAQLNHDHITVIKTHKVYKIENTQANITDKKIWNENIKTILKKLDTRPAVHSAVVEIKSGRDEILDSFLNALASLSKTASQSRY